MTPLRAMPGLRRVIGLMSGTSLDGVDAAAILTDGTTIAELGPTITLPYTGEFRARLADLLARAPGLDAADADLRAIEATLTEYHAAAVRALGWPADLIGFHGQTILHQPDRRRTWQIGDAARLARATGLSVVHDFRAADVASGGQGAPLAPLYHAALAEALPRPLAILNLGGVANLTLLNADGSIAAADIGPGNGPLDDWVRRLGADMCDRDGRYSAAGRPAGEILAWLLADPFFARPWPKSLDRLAFSARLATSGLMTLGLEDGAATLVAFVAGAAARVAPRPARWLVTGGGRHNPSLMRGLTETLGVSVAPVEAVGWNGDALEAQCFGFLAARSLAGLPLSLPSTTGVPAPMPGGRVTLPC